MANNNTQKTPEQLRAEAEWDAAKKSYGANVKELEKGIERFEGELGHLKSSAGALGGNVGKLISDTKMKTNANAAAYPTTSIVKRASKNVFEFPVFVSSSVPIEYATATNALLEQVYASFVQMAISQNPTVQASDVESGDPFKGLKSNVSKYLEYTDMFYAHDACYNVIDTDDAICEFHMISLDDDSYRVINESLDYRPLSEFDHFFQEAQLPDHQDLNKKVTEIERLERKVKALEDEQAKLRERRAQRDLTKNEKQRLTDIEETDLKEAKNDLKNAREDNLKSREYAVKQAEWGDKKGEQKEPDGTITTRSGRSEQRDAEMHELNKAKAKADMKAKAPQFMDETKINKLNTMKPLMMTVGVRVMNRGQISDVVDYVIGVKTHCRMIPAEVLPDFAEYPSNTMNFVSRKARWRAGELKFVDYLFSRKEKKQAAYDSRDPKRKWYHRLYMLAHAKGSSKAMKRLTGSKNADGLIPNVTVVLSKADVDMIESANGIDLLKPSTATRICNELFLISMVIVDTDAQSIKILLPDVSKEYEVHSLASVNKQLATLDSSSDVSREVSKMMRGR